MKVGLILPLFSGDPAKVLTVARDAERMGYHGVFVFDHLFPPAAASDRPALEAFSTLAAVAEATHDVTIGTLVTRISLRGTGLLAKWASWLDTASAGRLVLGVGTGDPIDRGEHETYGIPLPGKTERRQHLEETLVALKALFAGRRYGGGRYVPPLDGPLRPLRDGGPPVWVGAQSDAVVRLAGRLADGWNGWGLGAEAFERKVQLLRESAVGREAEATWAGIVLAGEDDAETRELVERRRARGMVDEAWVGTIDQLVSFLRAIEAAGATWAVLVVAGPPDRRSLLAERLLPALARPSVRDGA